jgi:hypothetical protein
MDWHTTTVLPASKKPAPLSGLFYAHVYYFYSWQRLPVIDFRYKSP